MKVFLDSIGCRLNQSEIEKLARQFRAAGHEVVASADLADLVVINTCTVTTEAASDSRQKIRQASRAGAEQIVVTGCWATQEPLNAANLAGITQVISNREKNQLVESILQIPAADFDREPLLREPLPGIHQRTRAFIKVQDGCDNFCTYCITRIARGSGRSETAESILADIAFARKAGVQEVVLSGVHLGSWGSDFPEKKHLGDLIRHVLRESDVPRIRLSSLEPWDLSADFFELWRDARLCRHLHLPLQSGSAGTLRRMARKTTPQAYAQLVQEARRVCPEIAITTDLIVGFPGETETEFEESLEFVRSMQFSAGHVFPFSPRPGTPAAGYAQQVPHAVRKERGARMRQTVAESGREFRRKFLNQVVPVLWETATNMGAQGWQMEGLADLFFRLRATSPVNAWNEVQFVRLLEMTEDGFWGMIEES